MMDMMNDGVGWGMMGGVWFFPKIFWILIFAGVVLIVKWAMERNQGRTTHSDAPLDILKKRYARGEIDRDTFERLKKEIEEGSG